MNLSSVIPEQRQQALDNYRRALVEKQFICCNKGCTGCKASSAGRQALKAGVLAEELHKVRMEENDKKTPSVKSSPTAHT